MTGTFVAEISIWSALRGNIQHIKGTVGILKRIKLYQSLPEGKSAKEASSAKHVSQKMSFKVYLFHLSRWVFNAQVLRFLKTYRSARWPTAALSESKNCNSSNQIVFQL